MPDLRADLPAAPRVTHPETKAGTRIEMVESASQLERFLDVPSFTYWGDPFYVPPLRKEARALFDRARNPFFTHGDARLFTAWHGNDRPVGRIAAFVDREYDRATGKRWGFFGFLEFLSDARLPETLLAEACRWLRSQGAVEIAGPVHFSPIYRRGGLLVDGFDDDPVLGTEYTPPSYPGFLARLGLETWYDLAGFDLDTTPAPPDALAARAREIVARDGLSIRPVDVTGAADRDALARLMDEAARTRERYAPLPRPEHDRSAARLAKLIRRLPEGAIMIERDGAPVGYSIALVDWNQVLKHLGGRWLPLGFIRAAFLERAIDRCAWSGPVVGGADLAGHGLILGLATWKALRARGYKSAHARVATDYTDMIALYEALGARRHHVWRVYKVPATFAP